MALPRRILGAVVGAVAAASLASCSFIPGLPGAGASGELSYEDSPLNEFFSAVYGGFDDGEWTERQNQIEELIASCMVAEGFEYVPYDYSDDGGMIAFGPDEDDGPEWGTRAYVEQYGFGYSTYYDDAHFGDVVADDDFFDDGLWHDPNSDYLNSLSDAELDAYYEALDGPQPDWENMTEDEMLDYVYVQGGCRGEAETELGGDPYQGLWENEQFNQIMERMDSIYLELEFHPEIAALEPAWADCIADAGYPEFSARSDVWEAVDQRVMELWDTADPQTGAYDPELLAEVQEFEIALAVADFDCAEEVDYDQTQLRVQFELEQRFIDENRAALDELVAAVEQGS